MSETRTSLIRDVRDPRHPRWAEFVAVYEPLVRGHLRKQGLQAGDVEEVTQVVFAKLSEALPGFDLDKQRGRFRTWLWRVTRNALYDWLRSERRRRNLEDAYARHLAEQPPADDAEPEEDWLKEHHRQVLLYALEQVRAGQSADAWACFEEYLIRGRPADEVARERGSTRNAVYVAASRVLKQVRSLCQEREEELGRG
jgi:RNA polymerase sigma-70 factor (ECF subfamily)